MKNLPINRIFLIGYMGSGKTTLGKALALRLNMSFVDLDHYIEQRQFKTVAQIFEERGEDEFRRMEHEALLEASEFENVIISTGGGAPCFYDNMDIMDERGLTVYLQLSPQKLLDNLKQGKLKRPLIKNKTDEELFHFIEENLKKRNCYYSQARLVIDPERNIDEIIMKIQA